MRCASRVQTRFHGRDEGGCGGIGRPWRYFGALLAFGGTEVSFIARVRIWMRCDATGFGSRVVLTRSLSRTCASRMIRASSGRSRSRTVTPSRWAAAPGLLDGGGGLRDRAELAADVDHVEHDPQPQYTAVAVLVEVGPVEVDVLARRREARRREEPVWVPRPVP